MVHHLEITFWHNPADTFCKKTRFQLIVTDTLGQVICRELGSFVNSGFSIYRDLVSKYATLGSTSRTTIQEPDRLYRYNLHTY